MLWTCFARASDGFRMDFGQVSNEFGTSFRGSDVPDEHPRYARYLLGDVVLFSIAFGILISAHLSQEEETQEVLAAIRSKLTAQDALTVAAWCRIASVYMGAKWRLDGDPLRSLEDFCSLAMAAPSLAVRDELIRLLEELEKILPVPGGLLRQSAQEQTDELHKNEHPAPPADPVDASACGDPGAPVGRHEQIETETTSPLGTAADCVVEALDSDNEEKLVRPSEPCEGLPQNQQQEQHGLLDADSGQRQEAIKVLDETIAQWLASDDSSAATIQTLYHSLVPSGSGTAVSKKCIEQDLNASARSLGVTRATWHFARCAELCRKAAASPSAEQKRLLLRSFLIYEALLNFPGQTANRTTVNVVSLLRMAHYRETLDAMAIASGACPIRGEAIEKDFEQASSSLRLLGGCQRFKDNLFAWWKSVVTQASSSSSAPAPAPPVTQASSSSSAAAHAPLPAAAHAPTTDSTRRPEVSSARHLRFKDLEPGTAAPWQVNAFISRVKPFASGSGFTATLEDAYGTSMFAKFFSQVEKKAEHAGVRAGVR